FALPPVFAFNCVRVDPPDGYGIRGNCPKAAVFSLDRMRLSIINLNTRMGVWLAIRHTNNGDLQVAAARVFIFVDVVFLQLLPRAYEGIFRSTNNSWYADHQNEQ